MWPPVACISPKSVMYSTLICHNSVKTMFTVLVVPLVPVPVATPSVLPVKTMPIHYRKLKPISITAFPVKQ